MRGLSGILLAAVVTVSGCSTTQPIYDVHRAPISGPDGKPLTMTEVQRAIERAGAQLGWQMRAEAPGHLTGRLFLRSHLAVVNIEHDTRSFSIRYLDSTNLDAANGMIHRAYNGWVQNLEKVIRQQPSI